MTGRMGNNEELRVHTKDKSRPPPPNHRAFRLYRSPPLPPSASRGSAARHICINLCKFLSRLNCSTGGRVIQDVFVFLLTKSTPRFSDCNRFSNCQLRIDPVNKTVHMIR
ncbi:hypothetical protein F2P81_015574 [Scophthalmus maximus]|uniref:Uncharacterized protein n=1 Tax=Scophthalmus maximus TaxID=52904 RepID=A0A6A4SQH9_SCOMX|nr:hypothetical protein F2P81_015574 [Scophthalmus maximus]